MEKLSINALKVFYLLNMLLLFFSLIASNTFAEFYVIAAGRGPGKEIKSLPYTINSPGFYYITRDLSCAAGTHGITINADNVTLDLMGFSLIGPGGTENYHGIYMDNKTNVEIRNGTVRNFPRRGIAEKNTGGSGHRIINIRVKENSTNGIGLNGKNNIVERCTAAGNVSYGIVAGSGSIIFSPGLVFDEGTMVAVDNYGASSGGVLVEVEGYLIKK